MTNILPDLLCFPFVSKDWLWWAFLKRRLCKRGLLLKFIWFICDVTQQFQSKSSSNFAVVRKHKKIMFSCLSVRPSIRLQVLNQHFLGSVHQFFLKLLQNNRNLEQNKVTSGFSKIILVCPKMGKICPKLALSPLFYKVLSLVPARSNLK